MNNRYASGKYRFEIRLSEEVPEGLYYRKIENMCNTQETPSAESEPKRRGRFADFFIRLLKEKPLGMLGGGIILLLIGISLFADAPAPYPYNKIHLRDRMQEASAQYLLGTDHVGRDLLSRLIHGARISLGVGLAATTLNVLVALLVGGLSGFLGGKVTWPYSALSMTGWPSRDYCSC